LLITLNIHHCYTSHSLHSTSLQDNNIRKSHNLIIGGELSYVITVRAGVENLMLFGLNKIFAGRICSTTTNHSHEPPLYLSDPGLRTIPCYILLYRTEVLSFNCSLSVAKYQHRLSATTNINIGIGPKKLYRSSSS